MQPTANRILHVVTVYVLALLPVSGLATSAGAQSPGLVSWWPGDGNCNDVVGGNNGAAIGNLTFAPGLFHQAFDFDGVTARVFVPDSQSLAITHSLCITAWVKPTSYTGIFGGSILIRGDNRVGYDPYWVRIQSDGNLYFGIDDSVNDRVDIFGPTAIDAWKFVAASPDDSTGAMKLYEDGRLLGQCNLSFRPLGSLDPTQQPGLGIGGTQSAAINEFFQGLVEDVKIYDVPKPEVQPVKLTRSPTSVHGGDAVHANLILNDSPIQDIEVSVTSSNPAVIPPAQVHVSAGYTSRRFDIQTTAVTKRTEATVTVTYNGTSVTAIVTVTP